MGFRSFVSSVGSAISSVCSSAINTVSNAVSNIGSAISNVATSIIAQIPNPGTIAMVAVVIKAIAKALGLIEEKETPEELGAKAMESEKSLEDFESAKKYIEHLRNEVELDIEKFEQMKEGERLACSAVGISILSKGIEEKEDIEIPSDFLAEIGKQEMKTDEVKTYIKNFKESGFSKINLSDYFKGNLSVSENKEVSSIVEKSLSELNPELSELDIAEKMLEMEQKSEENR